MARAAAWLQAALARAAGAEGRSGRFFLVVDEAWAILSNLGIGSTMSRSFPARDRDMAFIHSS